MASPAVGRTVLLPAWQPGGVVAHNTFSHIRRTASVSLLSTPYKHDRHASNYRIEHGRASFCRADLPGIGCPSGEGRTSACAPCMQRLCRFKVCEFIVVKFLVGPFRARSQAAGRMFRSGPITANLASLRVAPATPPYAPPSPHTQIPAAHLIGAGEEL